MIGNHINLININTHVIIGVWVSVIPSIKGCWWDSP